jgi:hypothetical protein
MQKEVILDSNTQVLSSKKPIFFLELFDFVLDKVAFSPLKGAIQFLFFMFNPTLVIIFTRNR